jgi:hypothetical protein
MIVLYDAVAALRRSTPMSKLLKTSSVMCLALFCSFVYCSDARAQNNAGEIRHIRVLDANYFFDVVPLNGIIFPPRASSVLVLDRPIPGAGTIVLVPKRGQPGDPDILSQEISDPINITFDSRARRLVMFEPKSSELVVLKCRSQLHGSNIIQRFKAGEFGVSKPNGIAVDPKTGTLYILDRIGPKIVQVDPGPNRKNYEGATALEEGRISQVFLKQSQGLHLRGLGFNHTDGCLYVFSSTRQELYRISEDGGLVLVGVLSGSGRIYPQGFVFAPSLDQTDEAGKMNLFIASDSGPNGMVSEWSLKSRGQGSSR